jgi:hypothetical protein
MVARAYSAFAGVDGVGCGACGGGVEVLEVKKQRRKKAKRHEQEMARTRTTKKLAQRVDLNYFKRPTAFKRARFWLCVLAPLLAVIWVAWRGVAQDARPYSRGRLSAAHAVLEGQCSVCHVAAAGQYSANATDSACLACHDGPAHQTISIGGPPEHPVAEGPLKAPRCAECHMEHRGRVNISAVSDQICARCHANLKFQIGVSAAGPTYHESHIHTFEDHPEFDALVPHEGYVQRDPGRPKFNHEIHLKPIRHRPNGPDVQLECRDCHRLRADAAVIYSYNSSPVVPPTNWLYASPWYLSPKPSYDDRELPPAVQVPQAYKPMTGKESMAPVTFAKSCAGCHSLAFDKRFLFEGVPHDKTEVVHEFLIAKFQKYIAAHPEETRESREPDRILTGKVIPASVRILTAAQWVEEQTAQAEELLWRKTCKQCHELRVPAPSPSAKPGEIALPQIVPDYGKYRALWMPASKFDHDAHRSFSCLQCHVKVTTSTQSSDVLLPGIATCKTCHAPGSEHAESRCVECHTYHNWAQRKEVKSAFTLPDSKGAGH